MEPHVYRRYVYDRRLVDPILDEVDESAAEDARTPVANRVAQAAARLSLWGDAVASCRLEGLDARVAADPNDLSEADLAAMRVSRAAAHALSVASAPGPKRLSVCSSDMAREIHEISMTGIGLYGHTPIPVGEWRDHEAVIRMEDPRLPPEAPRKVIHVGADPDRIRAYMARWAVDHRPAPGVHPVVRAGLAHLAFEKIHPFSDGNGRVGRILTVGMLAESGLPCSNISSIFERRKDLYYMGLASVDGRSDKPDATQWLQVFSGAAWDSVRAKRAFDERLGHLMDELTVATPGPVPRAQALVTELVAMPVSTTRALSARLGLEERDARTMVEALASKGQAELAFVGDRTIVRLPSAAALVQIGTEQGAQGRPDGRGEENGRGKAGQIQGGSGRDR